MSIYFLFQGMKKQGYSSLYKHFFNLSSIGFIHGERMVQKFRKDTLKKLIPEPGETQIHQTIWPPYKGAGLPATLSIHHQVEPTHEIHLCISQNCSMTKSGNSAIAHVLFYLSASKYLTEFNLLEYTRVLDEKLTNEDQGHDSDYIRRFNYSTAEIPRASKNQPFAVDFRWAEDHTLYSPERKMRRAWTELRAITEQLEGEIESQKGR